MTSDPVSDDLARELRAAWFRFLDTIAPLRPALHGYCLRMTGNVWDAEDLVQDTLLRGFGAIGRGDLHGETSKVANPRAYLLRTATNLWIDGLRHRRFEVLEADPGISSPSSAPPSALREAGASLFERAGPQQRAAIVLKDVFDFTLEEIAELLSTSVGAVKTALHRGRARLQPASLHTGPPRNAPSKELIDRFVEAFNARDVERVTASLLETASIEVQGVGGGRGRQGVWVSSSLGANLRADSCFFQGEWIVVLLRTAGSCVVLNGITRFEEVEGQISRIQSYGYCPETLAHVAGALGLSATGGRYHQPPEILTGMIETTTLPWISLDLP